MEHQSSETSELSALGVGGGEKIKHRLESLSVLSRLALASSPPARRPIGFLVISFRSTSSHVQINSWKILFLRLLGLGQSRNRITFLRVLSIKPKWKAFCAIKAMCKYSGYSQVSLTILLIIMMLVCIYMCVLCTEKSEGGKMSKHNPYAHPCWSCSPVSLASCSKGDIICHTMSLRTPRGSRTLREVPFLGAGADLAPDAKPWFNGSTTLCCSVFLATKEYAPKTQPGFHEIVLIFAYFMHLPIKI